MFRKYIARITLFILALFFTPDLYGVENKEEEVEAVKCWLKSDRSSVRVGENFNVILTCRVVETDTDKAVINEAMLDPSAVSFNPFEVVGGSRLSELKKGELRFFQYQYALTIISEDFFGKDILIPGPEISYRIERKALKDESIDTREKIYNLPDLPIKIQSLVPKDAEDIREGNYETFETVTAGNFRAGIYFAISAFLFLVAFAVFSLPFIKAIKKRRAKRQNGTAFSNFKLLGRIIRDLKKTRKLAKKAGWDSELVGRVLLALRIAGAIALSRKVSQLSTEFDKRGFEGQLKLRKGLLRPRKVMISADLTLEEVKNLKQDEDKWTGEFVKVFEVFNQSRYGDTRQINREELGQALDSGISLARQQRIRNLWISKKITGLKTRIADWLARQGLKKKITDLKTKVANWAAKRGLKWKK